METKEKRTKVVVTVLALAGLLGLSIFATAGVLEPSAAPGPTMKTLDEVEPRIPIPGSATPATVFNINNPGSYYLTGDRNASATGIKIDADNVTIDLMGYQLIGTDSGYYFGIFIVSSRHNVEIRNGTVRDFGSKGINSVNSTELRIIGIRAVSNGSGGGIFLTGDGNLVKDCIASRNVGLGILVGAGCTVVGNTANSNQSHGIQAGNGCTVTGNTVYNNQGLGIYAFKGCTVTGNTANDNQDHGIRVGIASTVIGNTAYFNQNDGININGYSLLIDQNTAYENNQSGGGYTNISACASCVFGLNVQ